VDSTPPPWHYERRISTLGPCDGRSKQFRGQYEAAVRHQLLAGVLHDVDVTVASLFIDWTHGGIRTGGSPRPISSRPAQAGYAVTAVS
jgi:hypothetical protein